jgi:outer membrane immunogenic protein
MVMRQNIKMALLAALGFAMIGVGLFGHARAADLPTMKGPAPAPAFAAPPPVWTGFFLGVNAGYAFDPNSADIYGMSTGQYWTPGVFSPRGRLLVAPVFEPFAQGYSGHAVLNTSGFVGGGQGGYRFQTGNFVIGGVVEFDGHAGGSKTATFGLKGLGLAPWAVQVGRSWDNALAADIQAGYLVTPSTLLYVQGGYAGATLNKSVTPAASPFGAAAFGESSSHFVSGWNVGGGIEQKIFGGLSVFVDYKYFDFGKLSGSFSGFEYGANPNTVALNQFVGSEHVGVHSVKAGVNYTFGGFTFPGLK